MLSVTLRGIVAHKIRLLLSLTAVTLGIAFLAGTMVLTDTIDASIRELRDTLAEGSDVSVRSTSELSADPADRAPVPASVVESVHRVAGVESAVGSSVGFAQVVDAEGKVVGGGASVGVSLPPGGLLEVQAGRAPSGLGEIAMDKGSADTAGLVVGDQVSVLLAGPSRKAELVGLVGYGEISAVPGATVVAFDPATANELLGTPGFFTTVEVTATDGVNAEVLRRDVAAVLPDGLEAVSAQQAANERVEAAEKSLQFIPMALMVFVAVSLFVAAFLIVNTFSMLVGQRMRDYGLLRAVGATSRQVFASVLVEALAIGAVASAAGFGLGVAAAYVVCWVLPQFGVELPATSLQVEGTAALVSVLTGSTVTVVAALLPAVRAGRVTPVTAILGLSTRTRRSSRVLAFVGSALLLTGLGVAASGVFGDGESGLRRLGLGALVLFVGLAALSRHAVRPLVEVLGRPWLSVLGVPGRLGSDHASRNPARTVLTAAALTVGLALVTLTSVFSASANESLGRALDEGQRADYLVAGPQYAEFSSDVSTALARRPEFDTVVGMREGSVRVDAATTSLLAAEPAGLAKVIDLDMRTGEVGDLREGGVLVHEDVLTAHGWTVGGTIEMTFARHGAQDVRIDGGFREKRLLGADYIITAADHERWFGTRLDIVTLVTLAHGVSASDASAAFQQVLADHPELEARTKEATRQEQERQLGQILALVTGMLGLALVIALLGIVNTLALSVSERTRELGLLRAIGMSKRQLRRTVRYEAALIALLGAVTGVGIGLAAAASLVHVLRDKGLTDFSLPVTHLAAYVAVAVLAGVVAASWPARRATRLDILSAIATE